MAATMTKQEQRAAERAKYIETTTPVEINEDGNGAYALIPSEDGSKAYKVHFVEPRDRANYATSCECSDHYYRKTCCKHMQVYDRYAKRIASIVASPAIVALPAAKLDKVSEVATSPKKPKQPRRSAANPALVKSLQLPAGVKVCKERRGGLVKLCQAVPTTCPQNATLPPDAARGVLNGQQGFNVLLKIAS